MIATMSAPRELNHLDDFGVVTVDLADSPIAELRPSEIYNVDTSTINDDYLLVLQDCVICFSISRVESTGLSTGVCYSSYP